MDIKELGIITRNWVDLAEDRDYWGALVNAALNLRIAYSMEFFNFLETPKHVKLEYVFKTNTSL